MERFKLMTVKINYLKKTINNPSSNVVLFVNENFNIRGLNKHLSKSEFLYVSDILKTSDLKKNILFYEVNSKKKIFLVSIKNKLNISDIEVFFSFFC